ncbi:uncharacterized protein LOC100569719 [Acyrthosiphon pisum]|uniref:Secreted protein n=1 Tax=Acyrthosiphon pisum TaxID=7029 RepID=A0A8R2A9G3_ACYPI|nr:uncharacterized protein LOC100569719 [Acyrthosiphon pisum]|eukprot:XP_003244259.1 PREDICTED: uncharacterized protein LOC100569719 [Acyrthosiphon pisum]
MLITWLCLLLMSYSLCQVNCKNPKPVEVKQSRSLMAYARRYWIFARKCPGYLKRFVIWIWKHIKFGVQCEPIENQKIRCITKGGAKKVITETQWKRIPPSLRNRLLKKTTTTPPVSTT